MHGLLLEDVLGEERRHRAVPDRGVLRAEHPVVLVGEVEEPVRGASGVVEGQLGPADKFPPQPQALADRHPVVTVAVDHQHRGADRFDKGVR